MWNPFRKKSLLSEEDTIFQVECFRWLLTHFGGDYFYQDTCLVLPTKDYFPSVVNSNESAAEKTFAQVVKYAGMESWPVHLQAQEDDPDLLVAPTVVIRNPEQNPMGTFSVNSKNEGVITYNPRIIADPIQMVATFAHELAHYLTGTAPESPPGGWENWEFATDIAATFLGFGIFQANAAFNFRQHTGVESMGWQVTGGGYLTEAEHCFSLAIFLRLKQIDPEVVLPHCRINIKKLLKRALNEIDRSQIIENLNVIEYQPIESSTLP